MSAGEGQQRLVCNLLRSALPNDLQALALRLCLVADRAALEAWRRWLETKPDAKYALGSRSAHLKGLLALLYYRLQQEGEAIEASLRSYLRTARAHEQLRTETVRRICRGALRSLHAAGIEVIVLKGMAMAETVYPEASLRHCHDLDLLVADERVPDAMEALRGAGFRVGAGSPGSATSSAWVEHPSGFPVGLHTVLYRLPPWNAGACDAKRTAMRAEVAGCQVRVLSPAQALVHICCHGLTRGGPHSPSWIGDAWFLLGRTPAGLDWEEVTAIAASGHQSIPLMVALEYLAERLAAPVPPRVFQVLRGLSEREEDIESARAAALMATRGRPLALLRAGARAGHPAQTVWWLLFPPPSQLRMVEGAAGLLPALYLKRLGRYVLRPNWRTFC